MTIFLVDLESVPTRYTCEWKSHVPKLLQKTGHHVQVISGPEDIPSATTPGAFLNFGGTNIYKASQVEQIARLFTEGKVASGDHFIFTDAWHPGIINLKYMSELLGITVITHGLWHAGSYDKEDFLGRIVGNKLWVRHAEKSFFHAFDYNYFATNFHIRMFYSNLLNEYLSENPWFDEELEEILDGKYSKIMRIGWPMEYMVETLQPYTNISKRDLILFPHRIAPEKQVEIFRDLAAQLPQYEFVVCQDKPLTKNEYHKLLGEAKIVFSANLQETLGISCYEGSVVNAIPMVPDRLSYTEMYHDGFKYPSDWTKDWDSYIMHREKLCHHIIVTMTHYEKRLPQLHKQTEDLSKYFFSADYLLKNIERNSQ
jgi:glycosyltransferase involved in cell wall biosynthesis